MVLDVCWVFCLAKLRNPAVPQTAGGMEALGTCSQLHGRAVVNIEEWGIVLSSVGGGHWSSNSDSNVETYVIIHYYDYFTSACTSGVRR